MRKILSLAALVFCIGFPIALWEGYRFLPKSVVGAVPAPSFAEGVTIVLAALAIVLACLALFVGGLAIWGYQSIKSEAAAAAERGVQKAVDGALKEEIAKKLNEASIKRAVAREANNAAQYLDLQYPSAFPAADPPLQVEDKAIATEYPEDKP
jgi:hypothetical protein